jgi:hypothetical protein
MATSAFQEVRVHWHVTAAAALGGVLDAFDFAILL